MTSLATFGEESSEVGHACVNSPWFQEWCARGVLQSELASIEVDALEPVDLTKLFDGQVPPVVASLWPFPGNLHLLGRGAFQHQAHASEQVFVQRYVSLHGRRGCGTFARVHGCESASSRAGD